MSGSAPRSIDEYLQRLRAALSGEDPALIQDALYDAEEYLRAEVAAHAGKPEAEALDTIVGTYGTPDEIAAAYRATEVKVKTSLATPARRPSATDDNVLRGFFAVYSDPRAYASMFFMLLSMVTGIVYFTIVITGLSLSLGLSVLIIGVPFFLAFIGVVRAMSLGEGLLLEAVTGERMPRRPVHPGAPTGFMARIGAMLSDSRTWTTLAYFILMLPLGVLYFTIAVTGVSTGLGLAAVPFVALADWLDGAEWVGRVELGPAWLENPVGYVLSGVVGVLLLTGVMHLVRGVGRMHARMAKALLVTPGA
jgi:uncharacterized membrane protein